MPRQIHAEKESTVYHRIWRSIAAMVAIVFIISGTAITLYVNHTTRVQLEEHEQAYLANVDTLLVHELSAAQQILSMMIANPFIVQSVYSGNSEWSTEAYWSGQIIVNAVSSNRLYNSIYVISNDQIAIKSSRCYQAQDTEEQLIRHMQQDFRKQLIPWRSDVGGRTYFNMMLLSAVDTYDVPNHVGGVMINLDLNRLADLAFVNHGEREVNLVLDGVVIASTRPDRFFSEFTVLPALANGSGKSGAIENGSYVFSLTNPSYGYTIYSVQDYQSLMKPATTGLWILFAVISALLGLALYISRRLALHAYVPVKTILIELEEKLPAGMDGTDETLNEVQRATRSIRRASEMVSTYRRDAATVRLSKYIHNGTPDRAINDLLEKTINYQGGETLHMLLFQAENMEDARMAADVLNGQLNGAAHLLTLDMPRQRLLTIACIPPGSEDVAQLIRHCVEQTLNLLKTQSPKRIFAAVHPAALTAEALPMGYNELDERMRSSLFCAESTLLCDTQSTAIPTSLSQHLYQTALAEDHEAFHQALLAYLSACVRLPIQEAFHQLATLCTRITEEASNRGRNEADHLESYRSVINTLFSISSNEALLHYLQNMHQTAVAQISERKANESNPLVDHVLVYMAEHYENPSLSATEVADSLGVSVSYLSRVINKALGCGFPEMLQRLRLEHAAEKLLSQPNLTIADLAQQCGFSSPSYFTASFKKLYGMTPSNYRLAHSTDHQKQES